MRSQFNYARLNDVAFNGGGEIHRLGGDISGSSAMSGHLALIVNPARPIERAGFNGARFNLNGLNYKTRRRKGVAYGDAVMLGELTFYQAVLEGSMQGQAAIDPQLARTTTLKGAANAEAELDAVLVNLQALGVSALSGGAVLAGALTRIRSLDADCSVSTAMTASMVALTALHGSVVGEVEIDALLSLAQAVLEASSSGESVLSGQISLVIPFGAEADAGVSIEAPLTLYNGLSGEMLARAILEGQLDDFLKKILVTVTQLQEKNVQIYQRSREVTVVQSDELIVPIEMQ